MVSDASATRVVSYNLLDSKQEILNVLFNEEERGLSSGMRELLAVDKILNIWTDTRAICNKHIYWCTDSTNVVSFLTKGSTKKHV